MAKPKSESLFPLSHHIFEEFVLGGDDERSLRESCNAAVDELIGLAYDLPTVDAEWVHLGQKYGLKIDRGEFRDGSLQGENTYIYRSRCDINCSLDEILSSLDTQSSTEWRKLCRKIFENFLDGLLVTRAFQENEKADLSVRWLALSMPTGVWNRDLCVLQYVTKAMDLDGAAIGVCLFTSIFHPKCPSLRQSHGLIRAKMRRTGFVLRQSSPKGPTTMTFLSQIDVKVENAETYLKKCSLSRMQVVSKLKLQLERSQYVDYFVPPELWVPLQKRAGCQVCSKNFSAFRMRYRCKMCGGVVCSKCSKHEEVIIPVVGRKSIRLCQVCAQEVQGRASQGSSAKHFDTIPEHEEVVSRMPRRKSSLVDFRKEGKRDRAPSETDTKSISSGTASDIPEEFWADDASSSCDARNTGNQLDALTSTHQYNPASMLSMKLAELNCETSPSSKMTVASSGRKRSESWQSNSSSNSSTQSQRYLSMDADYHTSTPSSFSTSTVPNPPDSRGNTHAYVETSRDNMSKNRSTITLWEL